MPRTLTSRLIAAMVVLIVTISVVQIGLSLMVTQLHFQEVSQNLSRNLAADVVADSPWLMRGHDVNQAAFKDAFDRLMQLNPSIELYLLDPEGQLMAFSAPPGRVKRDRVDLAPIEAFLGDDPPLPIRGDDPRDPSRRKVFSAAPLHSAGALQGYLYVVLGGEAYDSVVRLFQTSFVLRLAAGFAIAAVVLSLLAGVLSFKFLTRRLRRLTQVMEAFRQSGFRHPMRLAGAASHAGDEIDRLGETFTRMSERIADQFGQLQEADNARRELLTNVSHDLRTPMASLQGYLETLQLKGDDLSAEDRHRYLELATKHSRNLSRLTEELFQLARLEHLDEAVAAEPFSLSELAQDVALKFRLAADRRGVALTTDIPADTPFVAGDLGLVERVFDNLLENAIKYTPAGGTISLSVRPGDTGVEAAVADTGCGIPAGELPRIFDRFHRAPQPAGGDPGGTGLGLAIAQRILKLHGSRLRVQSTLEVGSTFTFRLPTKAA